MFWLGIIIGACVGALIATLIAYDRGMMRANREWSAAAESQHQLSKIITGAD